MQIVLPVGDFESERCRCPPVNVTAKLFQSSPTEVQIFLLDERPSTREMQMSPRSSQPEVQIVPLNERQ